MLSNSRGDTIVEVMISIGIISMILVSAYTLSNNNVQSMITVGEQGMAQKIAERQLEFLRSRLDKTESVVGKCFQDASTLVTACDFNYDGEIISGPYTGPRYKVEFTKNVDTHILRVSWDTVSGSKSEVKLFYYE